MSDEPNQPITIHLQRLQAGDPKAAESLLPLVYDELRAFASAAFRAERSDHTLQPTAIVHEAYLKLVDQRGADWQNRAHFLGVAAQAIRRILIDHARKRGAAKRTPPTCISIDLSSDHPQDTAADLEALELVMNRLAELNARQAKVVEMRFYGGMTVEEVAVVMGVSQGTVKGDWRMARAWLQRELESDA
ncbi:MAG: sigma-70 family RNA polymerase sigma factor [Planctomycetes bacterium]|nr:sigma-70 family RNA polymerase sigma factor [Planctomycetota bacterium]